MTIISSRVMLGFLDLIIPVKAEEVDEKVGFIPEKERKKKG